MEVRNDLERKLGLELPSTVVFDYPTVSVLCQFIGTLVAQHPGMFLGLLHYQMQYKHGAVTGVWLCDVSPPPYLDY